VNEKQRIQACIAHLETDKVPWQIDCTSPTALRVMKERGLPERSHLVLGRNVLRYAALDDYFGNHICYIRSTAVEDAREVEPGIWEDEWGVVWDRRIDRDIGTPVNLVLERADIGRVRFPDADDPKRYLHFEPLIRANPDRYIVVKLSRCLFERAWSLRGMTDLMVDFIENPSFVHELLEALTDFNLRLLERVFQYPVDAVRFSDDWGGQRGLLMSPDTWRRFIKPRLKRMYDMTHSRGRAVFIHTCGNVGAILDDLVELSVDVFNPLQPEAMDIKTVVESYAGRLAFHGGLSIQKTLPFGNAQEVRLEVRDRLALARRYGGYIVAPSHDMPPDIPTENIQAMVEELAGQG